MKNPVNKDKRLYRALYNPARSAISEEVKVSSIAEEVSRRLRNTSTRIPQERRMEILESLFVKMKTSGHSSTFMRNVAIKGIVGYENKLRRSKLPLSSPGYMPLYTGSFNSHGRARSKAQKKSNWYKSNKVKDGQDPANRKNRSINKKKGNQTARKVQPSTVIFVGGRALRDDRLPGEIPRGRRTPIGLSGI